MSVKRHICGFTEAHIAASYLAMGLATLWFVSAHIFDQIGRRVFATVEAPYFFPIEVASRIKPEPPYMPTVREAELTLYFSAFVVIVALRWRRWSEPRISRISGTGRLANVRRNLGDAAGVVTVLLLAWICPLLVGIAFALLDAGKKGVVAFGLTALLFGVTFAGALSVFWDQFSRPPAAAKSGRCQQCSYDLTGNVSGVCPECGRHIGGEVKE